MISYVIEPEVLAPFIPAGTELDLWRGEAITEHYWGYSQQPGGRTIEYQVEHHRWRVRQADEPLFDTDQGGLYGDGFAEALRAPPRSAFVAEGSPVIVRAGVRLPKVPPIGRPI
jgi:hypothetical protein